MLDIAESLDSLSVIGGLVLIGVLVWAESGLLIGLLLPGDTLLITAGFFAARGDLPLIPVLVIIFVAAILGDNTGYLFGRQTGARLFTRKEGRFFREEQLERAVAFYQKHGGKTVAGARIIPYARTLVPMIAGASSMRRGRFVLFNIIGALIWTVLFVGLGYAVGVEAAKQIERFAVPTLAIGAVVVCSPSIIYLIRRPDMRRHLWSVLMGKGGNKRS